MADRARRMSIIPEHQATAVVEDLAYQRLAIVNVFFYGRPDSGDRGWVLIDAGLPGTAQHIRDAAASRFGASARPAAVVLTHGHFDHVGGARELAEDWDLPVYAHRLEVPYLTGRSSYPPPDPSVGGGTLAALSWLYPRGPFDLGGRVRTLPQDGSVPGMPGWRWIHTPGHTAGHVSLFRDDDRALIAGDAFTTVKQESITAVLSQKPEIHGPPAYYTSDWDAAETSVRRLAELQPLVVATGHGLPLRGDEVAPGLETLARSFRELAVPPRGRYVAKPALTDERGIVDLPPRVATHRKWVAIGVVVAAGVVLRTMARARGRNAEPVSHGGRGGH